MFLNYLQEPINWSIYEYATGEVQSARLFLACQSYWAPVELNVTTPINSNSLFKYLGRARTAGKWLIAQRSSLKGFCDAEFGGVLRVAQFASFEAILFTSPIRLW